MKSTNIHVLALKITAIAAALVVFLFLGIRQADASIIDGTIDATNKYAWSARGGWINFGTSGGNVHVTDTQLTGYAWIGNFGWINLQPAMAGVTNNSNGTLGGYAWGEQTGYINFTGVTIDSNGDFHGYTVSNPVLGQISFNCANTSSCGSGSFKVNTDWRPRNSRPACSNGLDDDFDGLTDYPADPDCTSITGTSEGATPTPPPAQGGGPNGFLPSGNLVFNGGVYQTTNLVISVSGNAIGADQVIISESNAFTGASYQPITGLTTFTLSDGYGIKTIYYKFKGSLGETQVYSQNIEYVSMDQLYPELRYLTEGMVVKGTSTTVYYIGANGQRYVFPNEGTFFSWYPAFSVIRVVSQDVLSQLPIAGNVTYKPGSLVKLTTDPKVYVVSDGAVLHWIVDEATAISIYGASWTSLVKDIPDVFFTDYTIGANVGTASNLQSLGVSNLNPDNSAVTTGAIVYENINYLGKSESILHDTPDLRQSTIGNDVISSLRLFANSVVQLYQHILYQGRVETLAVNDPDLRNSAIGNDVISSIKVTNKDTLKATCGQDYVFTSYLTVGNVGAEVLHLQNALQCLGYFPSDLKTTDYFGLVTKGAVLKFQIAHGIPATGYVGVLTREYLNSYMK